MDRPALHPGQESVLLVVISFVAGDLAVGADSSLDWTAGDVSLTGELSVAEGGELLLSSNGTLSANVGIVNAGFINQATGVRSTVVTPSLTNGDRVFIAGGGTLDLGTGTYIQTGASDFGEFTWLRGELIAANVTMNGGFIDFGGKRWRWPDHGRR